MIRMISIENGGTFPQRGAEENFRQQKRRKGTRARALHTNFCHDKEALTHDP